MKRIKLLFGTILAMFLMNGLIFGQQDTALTVTSDGNVGIGTSTPVIKLDIKADNYGLRHSSANGSTQFATWVGPDQVNVGSISDHQLILTVNNAAAATFLPNGNVGIGTETPSSQLEVVGLSTSTITAAAHNSVAQFIGQSAGGNPSNPTAVTSGVQLAWFGARGYTGTAFSASRAAMIMNASEDWSNSAHGTEIAFGTTGNGTTSRMERMRITQDGNVGIGATTQSHRLTVSHDIANEGVGLIDNPNAEGFAGLYFHEGPGRHGWVGHVNAGSVFGAPGTMQIGALSRDLVFSVAPVDGFIERMRILTNGNVGIGVASPVHPLEMASGAHVTTGGVWTNASSRAYKENISNLSAEEAISTLAGLNPVKYNYKVETEEEYVGFIAEDVPDLVATNARNSLSPMDIVGVLTKVVQQQQKKIAELEARLNAIQ